MLQNIKAIASDNTIPVNQKEEMIVHSLAGATDKDIQDLTVDIIQNNDDITAAYLSLYLSLVRKHDEDKKLLVRQCFQNTAFCNSVFSLIKFMPPETINQLKEFFLGNSADENMEGVMYEIAKFFPQSIQDIAGHFKDANIKMHLYNEAPDSWTEEIYSWYKQDPKPHYLQMLAWIKTPYAVEVLKALYNELQGDDKKDCAMYLQSSGVDAATNQSTIFSPAKFGFVVHDNESNNKMGQNYDRIVPCCSVCSAPSLRLISIDASHNDLGLKTKTDPSFFIQTCEHHFTDLIVHIKENGNDGILTTMCSSNEQAVLFNEPVSLLLEDHPNQKGTGFIEMTGYANHQVGGYISWVTPDEFPICPLCKTRMKLLIQMDSGLTPFGRLPYEGKVFCFWCDDCSVSVTKHQLE